MQTNKNCYRVMRVHMTMTMTIIIANQSIVNGKLFGKRFHGESNARHHMIITCPNQSVFVYLFVKIGRYNQLQLSIQIERIGAHISFL